ncbi:MAG: hypothetical protein LBS11_11220 [Oscillospiraceae bacterium]|jgi:hypothetical protein|nr:hypothetical protein [Oscillospiraceae bacterium]
MPLPEYGSPLPKSIKARGYEIRRAPLGGMLAALDRLKAAPGEFLAAMTRDGVSAADPIGAALRVAPGYVIGLIGDLTGIGREKLESDPEVGLDGLLEIADAWLEINGIINFTQAAWSVWAAWKGRGPTAGCIGSSQERSGSGSGSGSCLRITTLTRLAEYFASTRSLSSPARNANTATSGTAP